MTTWDPQVVIARRRIRLPSVALPRTAVALTPLVVGLALWGTSLVGVDLDAMTDIGLLSVLPPTFLAALVLLTVGFTASLARPRDGDRVPALYACALIAVLHATPSILYGTLRYGWAWKHVGIVDYIQRHGTVDRDIQYLTAYHDWPGFFSLGALATDATGQPNALAIAQWAPPFFNLLFLGAVLLLFRTLSNDRRVVWGAAWLFLLGNWVGQDYFSPQAMSYFLYIVVLALLLRRFARRPAAVARSGRRLTLPRLARQPARVPNAIVIVLLCVAVISSHQLTPLMLILATGALTVCGQTGLRWLPVALGVLTVAWIVAFAQPFFDGNLYWIIDSIGSLGGNATTTPGNLAEASPGMALVAWISRALTAAVIVLALAGLVRRLRHGIGDLPVALLAFAPVALLAANSYGGEILFRVFLFGLPFLAICAARAFFPTVRSGRSWPTFAAFGVASVVLLAGTCFAYYGKERTTRFSHSEVDATRWLYDHAPAGALMVSGTLDYPWAWRRYERYDYVPLDATPVAVRKGLEADPLGELLKVTKGYADAYVVITRAQEAAVDMTGVMRAGTLQRTVAGLRASGTFRARLLHARSPWFSVAYETRDATILRLEGGRS